MENGKLVINNTVKNGYQQIKTDGDRELLTTTIILIVIGLMAVVSASLPLCVTKHLPPFYYVFQHLFWIIIGSIGMWFFSKFDYNNLRKFTFLFAFAVIILLLMVKFTPLGVTINGARRWLNLGFQFQPSELTKLALIMILGNLFSLKKEVFNKMLFKHLLSAGIMIFIVLKQPNLSMTLILLGISFCMYVCSGKTLKPIFIGIILLTSLLGMIKTNIIDLSNYIAPYQLERIMNWHNPDTDVQSEGYQVFHSLVAISSGGMFGSGYGSGKEKLGWLPESHTDFIFSVISEEIGFIGSLFVIMLFLTLLYRGITIATKCPNLYGRLLALGITISITMQAFFNISVATSFLPATGITLPFISYGGSSLAVSMSMIGILLNISKIKLKRISYIQK